MAEQNPPVQAVFQTVYTATADKSVTNTSAEVSLFSGTANMMDAGLTIPGGSLYVGRTYQSTIRGAYSTQGLLPGNLTIRVKLGGVTVATAAMTALVGAILEKGFLIAFTLTCRSLGTNGSVAVAGDVGFNTALNDRILYEIQTVTNPVVNTTVDQQLDVTAQWQTASTPNSLLVKTATVSRLL